MIKFLILFSFLINPYFVSLHVFSNALVLSTSLLLDKINFLLRQRSAFSLVIPVFNASTTTILLIHIDTSFLLTSHFFNILLFSLPHRLPVPRSYLYLSFFPFRPYLLSPQLLHLVHYKFIHVIRVLTPGLPMTHLLWHPPPHRRSFRLPLILPSPFEKVLIPLIILILFIFSYLIIVYLHYIMLLSPPCLLFLLLTLSIRPSLIQTGNRKWLKKWLLCILLAHRT